MMKPLLSILALLICASAQAVIYWDDEMEAGNNGYDLETMIQNTDCGGEPWGAFDTVNKVSGAASIKLNYPPAAAEGECGGATDRSFPGTTDLWSRFYIRLSPGFATNYVSTKVMRPTTNGVLSGWWAFFWGSQELSLSMQNYPTIGDAVNFYPNVGDGSVPSDGSWVCIETRIKLNAVGQADGVIEAYKNGVQFTNYTGLEFRKVSQGSQNDVFTYNSLFRQGGLGTINYDRLAFGNERIGPIGSLFLSNANDGTPTSDGCTGASVDANEGTGTLYWAVVTHLGSCTNAQLKAGSGGNIVSGKAGNQAVSATGTQTIPNITGLAEGTTYQIRFLHTNVAAEDSLQASVDLTTTGSAAQPSQVQIFVNTVNDLATATLLATVTGNSHTHSGLGAGATRYYWLRSKAADGNFSYETASVNATTT